jgi:hypothetical protein
MRMSRCSHRGTGGTPRSQKRSSWTFTTMT